MKNLEINPELIIEKVKIPNTNLHAYIIDDFLLDTDSVMFFANNFAYFNPMFSDNSYYPGIRDNMPLPYKKLLQSFVQDKVVPIINDKNNYTVLMHKCLLSLTSCKPSELLLEQKMPHVDSCKSNEFALVHYLSGKEFGGTSLYRYKPKSLIEFSQNDESVLDEMLASVSATQKEHSGYLTKSTSIFEQILSIEAKFNRLVVYQGNILHSANLATEQSYSGDARNGRLSIASFCSLHNN